MRLPLRALLLAALLLGAAPVASGEAPPEPPGYRLDDYRAPTPLTVAGQQAIDTGTARRLWKDGAAIFIDVIAAPRRPEALPAGALWRPKPHLAIPGTLWLPDAGRGALDAAFEAWLHERLQRLADERGERLLVFYCRADCWSSWNAAKRALSWGIAVARWFRDGIDGWSEAGLPLAEVWPPEDLPP